MEQLLSSLPGAISLGLIWGIMAVGLYITYKILAISDLTVDGSICTGAAVCTVLITNGVNPYLAIAAAVAAGALAGLVTGLIHTLLDIPAILAGILTQLALWSVNLKILGQANRPLSSRNYPVILTQMSPVNALITLSLFCVAIVAFLYWFFGTERGCSIRATGCNINMSRAQGINTDLNKILGLMLSNGLVALSGALLAQYQGFADINMGRGAIVIGLAAIVIGETLLSKIARNFAVRLCGVLLGGAVYYIVYQIIVFIGLDTDMLKALSAVVVAAFLGIPNIKNKYFSGKRARKNAVEVKKNA